MKEIYFIHINLLFFSTAALIYLDEFPWNLSRNERNRYYDKAVIDTTTFNYDNNLKNYFR